MAFFSFASFPDGNQQQKNSRQKYNVIKKASQYAFIEKKVEFFVDIIWNLQVEI